MVELLHDYRCNNGDVGCMKTIGKGSNALQGPFYGGTMCFHRINFLYGLPSKIDQHLMKGSERQRQGNRKSLALNWFRD